MACTAPQILVVGSLNVDLTFRVPRIPAPGETLTALGVTRCFGGKGANQAVAAARAGGRVRMIGCVGDDDFGRAFRSELNEEGIETEGIRIDATEPTGSAFITVDEAGENTIVVHPGANHALSVSQLEACEPLFEGIAALLLQLECPIPVVQRAAELARAAGAKVLLNPSPWQDAARDIPADVIIANESEARAFGASRREGLFVTTRGAGPTRVESAAENFELMPPEVSAVDTVGAGDAFAGAFTVAVASGRPLREAIAYANAAGALATLKPGAQAGLPQACDIRALLA